MEHYSVTAGGDIQATAGAYNYRYREYQDLLNLHTVTQIAPFISYHNNSFYVIVETVLVDISLTGIEKMCIRDRNNIYRRK